MMTEGACERCLRGKKVRRQETPQSAKNWNNAPNLDDDDALTPLTMTQSEQPSASKSAAVEEKQKRDQANPYM